MVGRNKNRVSIKDINLYRELYNYCLKLKDKNERLNELGRLRDEFFSLPYQEGALEGGWDKVILNVNHKVDYSIYRREWDKLF